MKPELQPAIKLWLAQIGKRGGSAGKGSAKRRPAAHYKAAGKAGAAKRWRKKK